MKSKTDSPIPLVNDSAEDGWIERQVIRNQLRVTRDKVSRLVGRNLEDLIVETFDALEQRILKQSKSTEDILVGKSVLKRPMDKRDTLPVAQTDQRDQHATRLAMMKARNG